MHKRIEQLPVITNYIIYVIYSGHQDLIEESLIYC